MTSEAPRQSGTIPQAIRNALHELPARRIEDTTTLYAITLLPAEAEIVFRHAQTVFDEVKKHPYGKGLVRPLARLVTRQLAPANRQRLHEEGIGVLVPLATQTAVQYRVGAVTPEAVTALTHDILHYTSKFKRSTAIV